MNELSIPVPGSRHALVKGFERWLTQEDIALVLGMSVRWVRENLLKTSVLPCTPFGPNSYRVRPADFRHWQDNGCPGFEPRKRGVG